VGIEYLEEEEMLELGIGADLVRGIGWILWGLIALGLWWALSKPETVAGKVICTAVVLAVPVAILGPTAYRNYEYRKRYEVANAHFDERCKTAGEKIYRTVEGVEGIQLWGMREGEQHRNAWNPDWQAAGMPNAPTDEGYVSNFLSYENNLNPGNERGTLGSKAINPIARGFRFVDVKKPDGGYVRYRVNTNRPDTSAPYLTTEAVSTSDARYAVDYKDISTPEGRAEWVAGGQVRVIDTQTGELMAEMIAFGFERGFGSKAGARQPWRFAKHCKASVGERYQSVRFFVDQVVKPLQGS
jgi:hypothetical protein